MMRRAIFFTVCAAVLSSTYSTPFSATSSPSTTTTAAASCATSASPPTNELFGILRNPKATKPAVLALRGGEVYKFATLADVDATVLRASADEKLVALDFSATWCGPCKRIEPVFYSLSNSMLDVVFIKIDVDENPDTAEKYSVSAMPTFVFVKRGEVVDRLMGANSGRLEKMLLQYR